LNRTFLPYFHVRKRNVPAQNREKYVVHAGTDERGCEGKGQNKATAIGDQYVFGEHKQPAREQTADEPHFGRNTQLHDRRLPGIF
jgi:hypothetical protein